MKSYRNTASLILYIACMVLLLGVWLFVVLVSKDFIFAKEGIGVYGVLIYYAAAFCSALLWGLSYVFAKNKKLAIIYWVVFLLLTIFIGFQPTWWAAPQISS